MPCSLLGLQDSGAAGDSDLLLLRLLTPIGKLYTAKQAVSVVSEGLESFGGQGYIEDTGIPGLLRDAQVLPVWEGTTNVLSLDVIRALTKTRGEAWTALVADVTDRLLPPAAAHPALKPLTDKVMSLGKRHSPQWDKTTSLVVHKNGWCGSNTAKSHCSEWWLVGSSGATCFGAAVTVNPVGLPLQWDKLPLGLLASPSG